MIPTDGPPPWDRFDHDHVLDDMALLARTGTELAIDRGYTDQSDVYQYVVAIAAMLAMSTAQKFDKTPPKETE